MPKRKKHAPEFKARGGRWLAHHIKANRESFKTIEPSKSAGELPSFMLRTACFRVTDAGQLAAR